MNVEDLETKIKEEKQKLVVLEAAFEKEEDANKVTKLEYTISRKEDQINRYIDRQNELVDKEALNGSDKNTEEKEDKEDKDVCPECGGDLVFVTESDEGDIYECQLCGEMYLDE